MGSRAAGKLNALVSSWFPAAKTRAPALPRTSSLSFDWTAVWLGTWVLCGVIMDGWAHNHFGEDVGTFFTPWHAILYSGFFASAVFLILTAYRYHRNGYPLNQVMPYGYGLSLAGVLVLGLSGLGDLIWHTLFGIEISVSAGFSPPHLGIMTGILLIVSGPLRSAWHRSVSTPRRWWRWLPALLSMHMSLTMMSFVTQYAHPLVVPAASEYFVLPDLNEALGAASILLQTAILMGWILFTLRRWRPPFGSLTIVLTLNAIAMCIMRNTFFLIPAIALAGICADLLLWWLEPSPAHPSQFHFFAFAMPVIYYAFYFISLLIEIGLAWPAPLWTGAIFMAGITSLLISYLIIPTPKREAMA